MKCFFTAPTAIRAIKKEDPEGHYMKQYDMYQLHALFLAGERSDPDTLAWAESHLRVPVVDNYWQTETGTHQSLHCDHNVSRCAVLGLVEINGVLINTIQSPRSIFNSRYREKRDES